jgi:Arc/MetJ-type ribon-helix-helix transcriptional regulator
MHGIMKSMKFSANVPDDVLGFLDQQVGAGHYASRSAALTEAITMWREHRLAPMYTEEFGHEDTAWDATAADGLEGSATP